jgi:hypothetical protein
MEGKDRVQVVLFMIVSDRSSNAMRYHNFGIIDCTAF